MAAYTPKHLAEKILRRAAIEGERKQVTVLFTDIAGLHRAGAERLDPEDVHEIMDRCFEIILAAVHAYEGTINQFTRRWRDGALRRPDRPRGPRASARCAPRWRSGRGLEPLRDHVQQRHGIDFRVRIGINTGRWWWAPSGDDLRMDYTAVGDTTNLAARLEQAGPPGSVLVCESTTGDRGFFETRDLGELP